MTFRASISEIVAANENGLMGAHATWCRVTLTDIASILNGFPFPSRQFTKEEGMPLLRIRDILKSETDAHYNGEYDPAFLVEPGELVVGMDGDFNCALWRGPSALLNQRVCKIVPGEQFYSKKLLAFVLPGYLNAINANTPSLTVKHLSSNTVAEIPLPLPPWGEQCRIVAEIEKQFTRLEAAVGALKRVQANLKRYRAAVLKAAVEGRLVPTEAELARAEGRSYEPADQLLQRILAERRARWEADQLAKFRASGKEAKDDKLKQEYKEPPGPDTTNLPRLPDGWHWTSLGGIADIKLGKMLSPKAYEQGLRQVPYLRNENVQWGRIDFYDVKTMGFKDSELGRYSIQPNDLLVCEGGEAGRCAVYTSDSGKFMYQKALHRVRTDAGMVDPHFLLACLWHYVNSGTVIPRPSETTIKHLPLQEMVVLPIPFPPANEQQRIVAEVERRLSNIDELEMQVEANLKRGERLRQAILKRAFEGKVVPQDPSDEPAAVLLERIRAEREARKQLTGGTKKGRQAKSAKAVVGAEG